MSFVLAVVAFAVNMTTYGTRHVPMPIMLVYRIHTGYIESRF